MITANNMKSLKYTYDEPVRVATYGRVSTNHTQQQSAFLNQQNNNQNIVDSRKNWKLVAEYNDGGISGTTTNRPEFQRMITDAKNGQFDLIITREVCRFARNTIDALAVTRELKDYGVEVFFYNDNIWSKDTDGELRLTIFSALAQEESRKVSERALAGQRTAREKGILFGNGNIFGYNLVRGEKSIDNTYVIVPEEAETIKMIYDMYLNDGIGAKAIATKLLEKKRKDANGNVRWDGYKVMRILKNRTYAGMIGYNKSVTTNYLGHRRKLNSEDEIKYVQGNFTPIISDEDWKKAQKIRANNRYQYDDKIKGKPPAKDRWKKIMICECGKTYRKYIWRTTKDNQEQIGYRCYNQVYFKKKEYYEKNNLDTTGLCDTNPISGWKLELALQKIIERTFCNPNKIINNLTSKMTDNIKTNDSKDQIMYKDLKEKQAKLENRKKNLLEMKLDDLITKEEYVQMTKEIESEMKELQVHLKEISGITQEKKLSYFDMEYIQDQFNKYQLNGNEKITDSMLLELFKKLIVCKDETYKWYLFDDDCDIKNHFLIDSFIINYEQAKAFRNADGHFLRKDHWRDMKIQLYLPINTGIDD